MSPHNKRSLAAALAGISAAVPGIAFAVNLSADGRGQVLLYPYYTTRADAGGNAFGTLVSVVNADSLAKAVRVRFLEGRNGREVLGFNLFLSPRDVWAAAVLPDSDAGGARIGTVDVSCTLPPFSASPTAPFVAFTNASYAGTNDDGAGVGLDRTKEGYFEIIEMATFASTSTTGKAVTHVPAAPPFRLPPCNTAPNVLNDPQIVVDAQPPSGGLFGSLTLINVASGTDYTADAVALANFFQTGSNYQPAAAALPDLTQASPPVSSVKGPDGRLFESVWSPGSADAVSAVLMHASVMNEYVLDSATRSGTDWVVTLPTKRHYVGNGTGLAPRLFQRNFNNSTGSCDDLRLDIYDREERTNPPPLNFPLPPPVLVAAICWTANVVTFSNSDITGSINRANIFAPQTYSNGWLNLGFPAAIPGANSSVHALVNGATSIGGGGRVITGNTATYIGLPAIGFAVIAYRNGTLQIPGTAVPALSNYGSNFVHKTITIIQ